MCVSLDGSDSAGVLLHKRAHTECLFILHLSNFATFCPREGVRKEVWGPVWAALCHAASKCDSWLLLQTEQVDPESKQHKKVLRMLWSVIQVGPCCCFCTNPASVLPVMGRGMIVMQFSRTTAAAQELIPSCFWIRRSSGYVGIPNVACQTDLPSL